MPQLAVHRTLKEAEGLASLTLCPGQRHAGVLEQLVRLPRIRRAQRDTYVRPHMGRFAKQVERLPHDPQQALADACRAGRRIDVGQDRELVRPHARQRVGLAQARQQARAQMAEQEVAGGVAERVVHRLEVGKVQAEHRRHPVAAPGAGQCGAQPLDENAAIGQTRQRVVAHHMMHLLLGRAQRILAPVSRSAQRAAKPQAERRSRRRPRAVLRQAPGSHPK